MSEELESCPFKCNGENKPSLWCVNNDYQVMCNTCEARGPRLPTQAEAIAAWNRRASPIPEGGGGEDALKAARRLDAYRGYPEEAADARLVARALLSSPRVEDVRRMREALVQISSMEIDINFMADQLVWAKGLAREALSLQVE